MRVKFSPFENTTASHRAANSPIDHVIPTTGLNHFTTGIPADSFGFKPSPMKLLLSLLALCFFQSEITAQQISGRVLDSVSQMPVAAATVSVLKSDSSLLTATVCDSAGLYHLTFTHSNSTFLKISAIGYKDKFLVRNFHDSLIQTYTINISLIGDPSQMKAVTIIGRRPAIEAKNDGYVYNAANDIQLAAGNAVDLMKRIPMIIVDQNGNISIPGKSSLRIYIDNQPSEMFASSIAEALKQVSSEDIEKIEVITSPSARYEAEGADAVINITTKKAKRNGLLGNVRAMQRRFWGDYNAGVKIRKNSLIFSANAGYGFWKSFWTDKTWRNDNYSARPTALYQLNDGELRGWSLYAGIGITKIIDSLKTINVGYRYRDGHNDNDTKMYNSLLVKGSTINEYQRNMASRGGNTGHAANFSYAAKSRNKKNDLSILAMYFSYNGFDNYHLEQFRSEQIDYREQSVGKTKNSESSFQVDNVHKLNAKTSIEAGLKYTFRNYGNDFRVNVYDFSDDSFKNIPSRSNPFLYKRGIYSAYINYLFRIKNFDLRVGARYEQTNHFGDFGDTAIQIADYKNLMPDFLVSRKLDKYNTLRVSYKKNILRPWLNYLNPYVVISDSLNVRFGNPLLLPSIQHGLQLVHNFSKGSFFWSNTMFINRSSNTVESIRRIRRDGIAESTFQNAGKFRDMGLISSLALNRPLGFSFNISANIRYVKIQSEALKIERSGYTYGTSINLFYRFNKGFGMEGSVNLFSRTIFLQGYETRWKQHVLLLSKKLWKDKLNITAGMGDFLTPHQKIKSASRSGTLDQFTESRYLGMIYRVGVSYSFGKKDLEVPPTRGTGDEN